MHQEFLLTRSNYYNQNFNTAIFFDPFRIYFNNTLESAALDLYYHVQKKFDGLKSHGPCFYILIYPDDQLFESSFGSSAEPIQTAQEGDDFIVGIKSISNLSSDYKEVLQVLETLRKSSSNA